MRKFFSFELPPYVYGATYLCLIPLFALLHTIAQGSIVEGKFWEALYFSAVTITTLGYGDIVPSDGLGKTLAATESVLGVVIAGLFLGSLSTRWSQLVLEQERKRDDLRYRRDQEALLLSRFSLIEFETARYLALAWSLLTPIMKRNDGPPSATELRDLFISGFQFSDLATAFSPSLFLTDDHRKSLIRYFIEADIEMEKNVRGIVKNADLRVFPEVAQICERFLKNGGHLKHYDALLAAEDSRIGEDKMTEKYKEWIEKWEGEAEYRPSNSLNAYVALFFTLHVRVPAIVELGLAIDHLKQA